MRPFAKDWSECLHKDGCIERNFDLTKGFQIRKNVCALSKICTRIFEEQRDPWGLEFTIIYSFY